MARIGVCEDDSSVLRVIVEALQGSDHEVVTARRGAEAMRLFTTEADLQVLVLDIGLPDADGRDVCQGLRANGLTAPVLFLTARGGLHDLVSGFGAGGDDYLVKPFQVAELRVRVAALARRAAGPGVDDPALRLDPARFSIRSTSGEAPLTPTEYRLLAILLGRRGEVVRRRSLVEAAWPFGAMVAENTLDSYMRRLRIRLEQVGAAERIDTVRGVGYAVR